MAEITAFQARCLAELRNSPNQQSTLDNLARKLKTARLGVSSALRSLERMGFVNSFRSDDSQWAVLIYALRGAEGKE